MVKLLHMKKIAKKSILHFLCMLCGLMLVSCDGGGGDGGGGGADNSGLDNEAIRDLVVVAYTTLIDQERIEYFEPGSNALFDKLEFVEPNLTNFVNREGSIYSYDSEPRGPQEFITQSTPAEGNLSPKDRLQRAVNDLIGLNTTSGVDGNQDFIELIRGDVPMNIPEMSALLNIRNAQTVGGDLVSVPQNEDDFFADGPTFYDHFIDSTYNAIFIAGVIEGNYNFYKTRLKIILDDATQAERDQLDPPDLPPGSVITYKIPRILEDGPFDLDPILARGDGFKIVDSARFKIFVVNTNVGR